MLEGRERALLQKILLVQQFVQQAVAKSKTTEPKPRPKPKLRQVQKTAQKKRDNSHKVATPTQKDSIDQSSSESAAEVNSWVDTVKVGKLLAECPCVPLPAGSIPEPVINAVEEDAGREPPNFLENVIHAADRTPGVDLRDIAFSYVLIGERIYRQRLLPTINQLDCRHIF